MKLTKSIDLAHQTKSKIPNINISSINQNNTYYNEISRNIKKSSKARNRKIFSHDSFNGEDFSDVNKTHNITINKVKKSKTKNKSRNSKLTPANYIKPLFYILNDQIRPINKQFNNYRNEKFFINFNYNLFPSFKNGDNLLLKTISNNNNNIPKDGNNENTNPDKNYRKRNHNSSFDDGIKNIKYNIYTSNSQEDNEILNIKANILQACYRSYISRNKFYNRLRTNNKDIKYSDIITNLLNNYFKKLNLIKSENSKLRSRNKLNNDNDTNYFNHTYNNNYTNQTIENMNKKLSVCKNNDFMIKSKNNKYQKRLSNSNIYFIKKQNESLEKEREIFMKEKKLNELKMKELKEENNKLKKKNIFYEKNKLIFEQTKEENETLKEKIKQFEERIKECEIIENKYKNLVDQNEVLYQENMKLNQQIDEKIQNLIEVNKQNQEKIKLYENTMNDQEAIINENRKLNQLNDEMKNKMDELIKENNTIKEKLEKNEIKNESNTSNSNNNISEEQKNSITQENEKLISENKKINQKNEELQSMLEEMKKKVNKLMKANKFASKFVTDSSGTQSREKSHINSPYELNEENKLKKTDSDEIFNNHLYIKKNRERKSLSKEQLEKEKRLKKLLKNKLLDMKDYLHRQFMKFYYNGIFVQMQKKKNAETNTKVVKSRRFSELINKFNSGPNKLEKIDINKDVKRGSTRSYDDKINNNIKQKNIIYENNDE